MHRWPGAIKEYWSQKHRTTPSYSSPQNTRKKKILFETAGDEVLSLPAADTSTSEWKPETPEKNLTKFFRVEEIIQVKNHPPKYSKCSSCLLAESELELSAEMWPEPPGINGKALLGNSAREAPLLQGSKSVPLFSSACLERQSLRQDSAINSLRKRLTKMLFWGAGNTDNSP